MPFCLILAGIKRFQQKQLMKKTINEKKPFKGVTPIMCTCMIELDMVRA